MKHSESCGVFIIRHDARYMVLLYYLTFRMHFLFRALFISGIVLMPLILVAKNRNAVFTSPERQVRLIELYTSEGCSSCPPADRWLSGLLTESHLWSSVVPIAFHVSYWDYLGWRDPFASEEYAKRQRIYASYGGTNVYTPGFFVNGREWRGFFENRVLPSPPNLRPGILKAMQIDDDIYEVTFHEIETDEKEYRVHAALLGFGLSSQVKRGENRGLQLQHDFVVVSYQNAILKKENNDFKGELKIVFPDKSGNSRKAIAFWVTTIKSPIPIQSIGGFIRDPV